MTPPELVTKLCEQLSSRLSVELESLQNLLISGDLHKFESQLEALTNAFYNDMASELLNDVSQKRAFDGCLRAKSARLRLGKLKKRVSRIQLRTGHYVEITSLYASQIPPSYTGSRHLSHLHWGLIKGASPRYYSLISAHSVLCCSFEVAQDLLNLHGIHTNLDRIRTLSLAVAQRCAPQRAALSLSKTETLAGKRVVIGIDGGRSRLREPNGQHNEGKSHEKYETHWREPKLFVISTLNEQGKMDKETLPLYDAAFGDDEAFELLAQYLKKLNIHQAQTVQFIADGATWIWNRAKKMLMKLGVAAHKIIETLDYYHATQHLNQIITLLPQKALEKQKIQQGALFKELKNLLWKGDLNSIIKTVKSITNDISDQILTQITYFLTHKNRMQYQKFNQTKCLCGSGIVESAVRRIINLRFKSTSAFWLKNNLQTLIFLRCIFLAKRWDILMSNLAQ